MSTFSILNDNSSLSKVSCHSVMLQESSLYTATWLDPKVSFVPSWHGLCFAWVWSAGTHYASNWRTIQHGNHVLMSLMAVIVRAIFLMNPEFLSCCFWPLIFDTFDSDACFFSVFFWFPRPCHKVLSVTRFVHTWQTSDVSQKYVCTGISHMLKYYDNVVSQKRNLKRNEGQCHCISDFG